MMCIIVVNRCRNEDLLKSQKKLDCSKPNSLWKEKSGEEEWLYHMLEIKITIGKKSDIILLQLFDDIYIYVSFLDYT